MSERGSVERPLAVDDAGREWQLAFFEEPAIPDYIQRLVESYIEKKTGKAWDDPVVLDRMRNAILAQKSRYWKEKRVSYRKAYQVLGYLAYHAPVYLVQFEHILWQIINQGLAKPHMRILDLGTGPGVVPLAVIDLLGRLGSGSAEVYAVEQSEEHFEAYNALVPAAAAARGNAVRVEKPIRADIGALEAADLPDRIDLMVFSNVLNEFRHLDIDRRADLVAGLADRLAPDGTIVVVEPADLANSTAMRQTVRAIAERGLAIYSPCSFIRGTACNPVRCWTFEQKGDIRPTRLMERLAARKDGYRFINVDIKYSSALLRKDAKKQHAYRVPPGAKFARLSHLRRHRDKKINVVTALMSGNLGDNRTKVYKVCDGTPADPTYAVVPATLRGANRDALEGLPYGDIVRLYGVLVRFNRDHDAYNLVVLPGTRIEPVGRPGGEGTEIA
ncbi:Methyltransferase domain protein [Methanoculleus chikugoensis]|jgi:SAM-dependent methyltransferase|uniref:Methyltransferase domain protein n=1 Tax=Methanoculleus chikugoensis TaxID=118126 RepID=A0A1M4MJP0_9EURY|nr:class I SAM-dependent methyltransferase [Methanoculleus chikugoensis]MDD4567967.1 class I SAM-dependent methyltransferase [Methanoculleus chikugoensis]NMA09702.1 class I SAM-dependent methyltransferase [Methanomicrobiales archaeon]SCL75062.1 Methyltransferase domain protein [Methanoculleus chikugoensis]